MKRPPELPADFVRGYWGAVRDELVSSGLTRPAAEKLIGAYREHMKNARWAIYNTSPEDTAADARLLKKILDDKKAGRWKPAPPAPEPQLPERAVNSYWAAVRGEVVNAKLSEADADAAIQAYRTLRQDDGMGLYNDSITDAAKYVLEYRRTGQVERPVMTVLGEEIGQRSYLQEGGTFEFRVTPRGQRKQTAKTSGRLPTEEEIKALPGWAQVALAARIGRRVFPLATGGWPNREFEDLYMPNLRRTVEVAEQAGTDGSAKYETAKSWARSSAHIVEILATTRGGSERTYWVAKTMVAAADTVIEATSSVVLGEFAALAVRSGTNASEQITPAIGRDWKTLLAGVKHGFSQFPPSVFGPLWPEGPPKDWPELPKPTQLKLTVQVPDGMDDAAVCEKLKALMAALSRLNVAGGGHGLKLVPPVEFTEEQVRGLADVVREEKQKPPGGRHPRR